MIFGREPAAWSGAVAAVLAMLLAWDDVSRALHLTNEKVGLIMAVVNGLLALVVALMTKDVQLSVVVGFVQAVLALAVGYGLDLTVDQTAAVVGAVTVGFAFVNRNQNSPSATPSFRSEVAKVA